MSERVKLAERLALLEHRYNVIERLMEDVKNRYAGEVAIRANVSGTLYERKYKEEYIEVDRQMFWDYLNQERCMLDNLIDELIKEIQEVER